jgi:hypothetical protein
VSDNRPNIWRLQALADAQGLIKALEYGDPDVRQRAAVALRALEAFEAIPALRAVLAKEDNPDARTIITSALVHLLEEQQEQEDAVQPASPPDEVTLLVEQLKSKDADEMIHAVQALGALGDPLAVEPLMLLFNNRNLPARVRLAAAEALIELKSPPTTVTALVALRRPDPHLRRIAAAMLGHLEADWAVEPLAAALKDENELVRRTARAALKHIATPEALAAVDAMPDQDITATVPAVQSGALVVPPVIDLKLSTEEKPVAAPAPSENEVPSPEGAPVSAGQAAPASKPEWSLEKTRPSRPEGLDAAVQGKAPTPAATLPAQSAPVEPAPTPATAADSAPTVSTDGAAPQSQS